MKVTRVKICGMKSRQDIEMAARYGVDAVGFITEVPVETPRKIDIQTSAELISSVPFFMDSVLVIMPGNGQQAMEMIDATGPDVVQLHRQLSVEDVEFIRDNTRVDIIKTFSVPVEKGRSAQELVTQINTLAERDIIDGVLLDSSTEQKVGGTGQVHDWTISKEIVESIELPVMLAGGLNPENVREAILKVEPYAVDTISGIETQGAKDEDKIHRFVKEARCIDDRI